MAKNQRNTSGIARLRHGNSKCLETTGFSEKDCKGIVQSLNTFL